MPSGHPSETLRPLTPHALTVLRELAKAPKPSSQVNPGVVHRLVRGKLAVLVDMQSPFASHAGRQYRVPHLKITDAGRALVGESEQA